MRSALWHAAVAIWIVALGASLIAGLLGSSVIVVAFPVMLAAGTAVSVLCYGFRWLVVELVPFVAVLVLVGWALSAIHAPSWAVTIAIPVLVVLAVRFKDHRDGRGRRRALLGFR